MAEIKDNNGVKVIAYYLPQYHAIPENDHAWGMGFTEWTNTRKASPLFEGHYQPKTPLNDNYYNLLDDDVKIWQSNLAQQYGVFGFCYYHYWFKDGKKLLEKPAEQMLLNRDITIPFCFSWANENWSKRWDGGNQELIAEQNYGGRSDWKKHFDYLLPFFQDQRYITLDGKPVFLIYKPEEMSNVNEMLELWEEEAKQAGLPGMCFMIQNSKYFFSPQFEMGRFSYQIKFYPFFSFGYKSKNIKKMYQMRKVYSALKKVHLNWFVDSLYPQIKKYRHRNDSTDLQIKEYDDTWKIAIESESNSQYIEGAFVDWDNTARKKNGLSHIGATPEKFGFYMSLLIEKILMNNQEPVIFINAWNEWGEGAYLEPDEKHQYGYLEALKNVVEKTG